jgi:hypothetical protein
MNKNLSNKDVSEIGNQKQRVLIFCEYMFIILLLKQIMAFFFFFLKIHDLHFHSSVQH